MIPEANKITASTPYDFEARNLTAYGGLLPATMLEKLGFQRLVEGTRPHAASGHRRLSVCFAAAARTITAMERFSHRA